MDDDIMDIIKMSFILLGLSVVLTLVMMFVANEHQGWMCDNYSEVTGRDTKYISWDTCYIKVDDEWIRYDSTYRRVED